MMLVWEEPKRKQVIKEHSVDFAKIEDIFQDVFSIDYIDEKHSTEDEIRYVIIAKTAHYGLTFLVYAQENENQIKCVTARRAEGWMVRDYEKNRRRF